MFYVGDRVKIRSARLARLHQLTRDVGENLYGEIIRLNKLIEELPFTVKLDRKLYEGDDRVYCFGRDELELIDNV